MKKWQLQEAKAKLSEVIDTAKKQGPQVITQRGVETAVVLPIDEWKKLQTRPNLLEVLINGPKFDFPLPERGKLRMRKPVKF